MSANPKIFVVDDEAIIAETLATILDKSGFEARSFTNPFAALDAVSLETPQLLLSDVMMPGMNGIELAIEFRAHCPECKIILFSGQAATADFLSAARSDGHDFDVLSKPLHPIDLLQKVRELIQPPRQPLLN